MSVSTFVLTQEHKLPTTAAWQAALASHGFAVELDAGCEVVTHEGFWPATYQGRSAGFELCCEPPDDLLSSWPDVEGSFDVAVGFVTHADMDQGCSGWLAAAALAQLTGGVLIDESAGEQVAAGDAIAWAREVESEALC